MTGIEKSKTGIVFDPLFLKHTQQGHPESSERLSAIMNRLKEDGLLSSTENINFQKAVIEEVNLCHTKEYIEKVEFTSKEGGGYLDPDTYTNEFTYDAAMLAVGGLLSLTKSVLKGDLNNGFALIRPPGHHALSNRGMGFCVFGNAAIAVKYALKNFSIDKVAIVDIDVHHGNGTQALIENDPNILFVSTHQYPFYPGTGGLKEIGQKNAEGTLLNIPLEPGVADNGYKNLYDEVIKPKLNEFNPDLLIVSAGYDAHWDDPLANMSLSLEGYFWISKELIKIADEICESKIVFTLEGGYNLQALSYGVSNSIKALMGKGDYVDPVGKSPGRETDISRLVKELKSIHSL